MANKWNKLKDRMSSAARARVEARVRETLAEIARTLETTGFKPVAHPTGWKPMLHITDDRRLETD